MQGRYEWIVFDTASALFGFQLVAIVEYLRFYNSEIIFFYRIHHKMK